MVAGLLLPIAPAGMFAVMTPSAPTEAALIRAVAVKAGMPEVAAAAVVQLVNCPCSWAQIATAFFKESRLARPDAAFDFEV